MTVLKMLTCGWLQKAKGDEKLEINVEDSRMRAMAKALEWINNGPKVGQDQGATRQYRGKTRLDEYLN